MKQNELTCGVIRSLPLKALPGGWGRDPWWTPECDNPLEYVPFCIECLLKLWHWYESLCSPRHTSQFSQNVCSGPLLWDRVVGGRGGGSGTSLMSGWNVLRCGWPLLVWVLLVLWELFSESVSLLGYEALFSASKKSKQSSIKYIFQFYSIKFLNYLSI